MSGMPLGPPAAAFAVVVMTVVASALIVTEPDPFSSGPGTMAAAVLIAMGLIAAAGMLLARGRWARWLVYGLGLTHLFLIAATGADWPWRAAAATALAIELAGAGPGARGWLRRLPSADGPPPAATLLLLGLVAFPMLVATANIDDLSPLAVVGSGAVVAAAAIYSRSGVAALWSMRALVPVGVALTVIVTPLPWNLVVAAAGAALVALTWAATVRQAAAPLIPLASTGYRIPPQLTPPEILDAAGLDSQGRQR